MNGYCIEYLRQANIRPVIVNLDKMLQLEQNT